MDWQSLAGTFGASYRQPQMPVSGSSCEVEADLTVCLIPSEYRREKRKKDTRCRPQVPYGFGHVGTVGSSVSGSILHNGLFRLSGFSLRGEGLAWS